MSNEKERKNSLKEKSLPSYEFKWKHENFPAYTCVCIYIMQWMRSVVQLKLYFIPTREANKKEKMNALHCMIINWLKKCHSWLHNCNIMCTSCTWMHSKELPAICSICPCLCSFIRTMFISHVIILWMFFELKIHSSSSSIFGCKIFLWS